MDNRAATPAVGKALEAGIVVLYIGLLTTTLYGGVVPDYRSAAGDAVGERALSTAAERVQQSVSPAARTVAVRTRVDLPGTLRGKPYRVRAEGRALVLDHPHSSVGGRVPLALPGRVDRVEGEWSSTDETVVRVTTAAEGSAGRVVVRLESAGTPPDGGDEP